MTKGGNSSFLPSSRCYKEEQEGRTSADRDTLSSAEEPGVEFCGEADVRRRRSPENDQEIRSEQWNHTSGGEKKKKKKKNHQRILLTSHRCLSFRTPAEKRGEGS